MIKRRTHSRRGGYGTTMGSSAGHGGLRVVHGSDGGVQRAPTEMSAPGLARGSRGRGNRTCMGLGAWLSSASGKAAGARQPWKEDERSGRRRPLW